MKTKNKILAVINNTLKLKLDTIGLPLLSELQEELCRDNPQYHMMDRMRQRQPQKYAYIKMPPQRIESIYVDNETVYIPRGCRSLVVELAKKHDHDIQFIDETLMFDRDPSMKMIDGFELLPYQKSNLAEPCIKQSGVVEMPCGGGKTVFGIALAMTLGQPTLILVHTTDLLEQWLGELASKALVPGTLGQWGAGKKVRGRVTVGTIQTLVRMAGPELRKLLGSFGCIILDECHHCPADTFLGIMNLSPSRYRYGFTATKERKDGLHFLMHDTIGPVVVSVNDSDLQSAGRSQSVSVKEVRTTFHCLYTADQWAKLVSAMVADEDRNRLIVENVVKSWQQGHFNLVLSDRVGHCRELCSALEKEGMNARLLVGAVSREQRKQIIDDSRNNLVDVIVATKVADEGLDIPALSCLHLTIPTGNEGKTKQRIGRIRRPLPDKVSVVYDYIDTRLSSCVRMSKLRRRFYRNWGFNTVC